MTGRLVLEFVSLFFAGLLAGEELVVRYGVHPSLAILDERSQVLARQGLIRRLRVLVPSILVPTVLAGIATLIFAGTGAGYAFRWAGVIAMVALVLITFLGTVRINEQIDTWSSDSPPPDWKATVHRWEQLDIFRSSAAILAFAYVLAPSRYRSRTSRTAWLAKPASQSASDQRGDGANWLALNCAPCGSRIRAVRVHPVSALARTWAPSRSPSATAWSRSATVNETCQCGCSSARVAANRAMASSKPTGADTCDCRALMSGSTVASRWSP
jgi:hypothetical protein